MSRSGSYFWYIWVAGSCGCRLAGWFYLGSAYECTSESLGASSVGLLFCPSGHCQKSRPHQWRDWRIWRIDIHEHHFMNQQIWLAEGSTRPVSACCLGSGYFRSCIKSKVDRFSLENSRQHAFHFTTYMTLTILFKNVKASVRIQPSFLSDQS